MLFNLGSIADEPRLAAALDYLQRSLRGSAPTDSIVRKLFALIARCHQMLGDLAEALNACSGGLRYSSYGPSEQMGTFGTNLRVMMSVVGEGCFVCCQAMEETFTDASALLRIPGSFLVFREPREDRCVVMGDAFDNQAAAFRP